MCAHTAATWSGVSRVGPFAPRCQPAARTTAVRTSITPPVAKSAGIVSRPRWRVLTRGFGWEPPSEAARISVAGRRITTSGPMPSEPAGHSSGACSIPLGFREVAPVILIGTSDATTALDPWPRQGHARRMEPSPVGVRHRVLKIRVAPKEFADLIWASRMDREAQLSNWLRSLGLRRADALKAKRPVKR